MIILDMDNCISDDGWRLKFIDDSLPVETRWNEYHAQCAMDRPANGPELLCKGHTVIISTSRPDIYRAHTINWLARVNVFPWIVMMRKNDDHSPSVVVKERNLRALRDAYEVRLDAITMAFDDRADIIEMYKRNGVPATRLWIHDGNGERP